MPDGVNDDLGFGRLVENEIGIWRCRYAADRRIIHARADIRMRQQKIDDELNARLNIAGTLRRVSRDVVEDRIEIGERRKSVAKLHKPCLAHAART